MPQNREYTALGLLLAAVLAGCARKPATIPELTAKWIDPEIGGRRVAVLSQPQSRDARLPQILSIEILPGRGMNIFQMRAYLPDKGVIDLIASPSLEEAKQKLASDPNASFSFGGAILVPFANRIRGALSADGKTIQTTVNGKSVRLPANWKGKNPGAEPHAMHGLILSTAADQVELRPGADQATVTAVIDAGDFEGHWPGNLNLTITATLEHDSFGFTVVAKNVGQEDVPVGIGWHPYFAIPSGRREQVILKIPARSRAFVNNYDDVFPTGEIEQVFHSKYDFSDGAALGNLYLDDSFLGLPPRPVVAEIIDPAAHYGLRIKAISPEISAFQVYAPLDQAFVALEPQFNLGDPYNPVWGGRDTGMKVLKSGESVSYSVQLEIFVPNN
jgi:galactose mutarotase-like enzyme